MLSLFVLASERFIYAVLLASSSFSAWCERCNCAQIATISTLSQFLLQKKMRCAIDVCSISLCLIRRLSAYSRAVDLVYVFFLLAYYSFNRLSSKVFFHTFFPPLQVGSLDSYSLFHFNQISRTNRMKFCDKYTIMWHESTNKIHLHCVWHVRIAYWLGINRVHFNW